MNRAAIGSFLTIVLALTGLASLAAAADIFVSPKGSPTAPGTREASLDLPTALSAKSPVKPGDTVYLLAGTYEGTAKDKAPREIFKCAVSGSAEQPVKIQPVAGDTAIINGSMQIDGSYVHLINLEIGELEWHPTTAARLNKQTISVNKTQGVKLINCNIFAGAEGAVVAGVDAVDLELYGCLIHDFGGLQVDRVPMDIGDIEFVSVGFGSGFSGANQTGTKVLTQNILYRGGRGNIDLNNITVGYDLVENIAFAPQGLKSNEAHDNFLIRGGYGRNAPPPDRIRLIGNIAYQPRDISSWRPNVRVVTYLPETQGGSTVVKDNYFMGARHGLSFSRWKSMQITGNTIWATGSLMDFAVAKEQASSAELKNFTIDGNTYIENGNAAPFRAGGFGGALNFEQWQKLGFDAKGQVVSGKDGRPSGAKVFLFLNKHQKGRGQIGVFNWQGNSAVEVDLSSILSAGQKYRIYNCLDITKTIASAKPVLSGAYGGGKLSLPMKRDPMSPDFDAFLVLGD